MKLEVLHYKRFRFVLMLMGFMKQFFFVSQNFPEKHKINRNKHNARIKEKLTEKEQNKNTFFNTKIFWCKIIFFFCELKPVPITHRERILLATAACFLPAYPVKTPCNIPTTSVKHTEKRRRGIIMPQPACVVVCRWGFVEVRNATQGASF